MKIRDVIILALLFYPGCAPLNAQSIWEWTDHVPLTDSLADNCNPYLHLTNYNEQETLFLFWDRSADSVTTEIWMDNILDDEPAQLVLSDSGVSYTRPRIMDTRHYPNPDTLFFLFYESDQNGSKDLFYMAFHADGSFSPGETLSDLPGNDEELTIGREEFYDGSSYNLNTLAWINNGKLYACLYQMDEDHIFSDYEVIDSSLCRAPVVDGYNSILYETTDTSKSFICSVYHTEGGWNEPEIYYDSTDSKNPTRTDYWGNACWSLKMDTVWKVIVEDWGTNYMYNLESEIPFDPAIMGIVIGVSDWVEAWVAVEYAEDSIKEIFMTGWGEEFQNFSNSGTQNRKPAFFRGEGINGWCWYDYILWESLRNGHWQIWSSKVVQCVGGVKDDDQKEGMNLKVHPNPLAPQSVINFELKKNSDVAIVLYNMQGETVRIIIEDYFKAGSHTIRLDAENLMPGTYILRLSTGKETFTAKVLKSN
jgi:hypothetical protein